MIDQQSNVSNLCDNCQTNDATKEIKLYTEFRSSTPEHFSNGKFRKTITSRNLTEHDFSICEKCDKQEESRLVIVSVVSLVFGAIYIFTQAPVSIIGILMVVGISGGIAQLFLQNRGYWHKFRRNAHTKHRQLHNEDPSHVLREQDYQRLHNKR